VGFPRTLLGHHDVDPLPPWDDPKARGDWVLGAPVGCGGSPDGSSGGSGLGPLTAGPLSVSATESKQSQLMDARPGVATGGYKGAEWVADPDRLKKLLRCEYLDLPAFEENGKYVVPVHRQVSRVCHVFRCFDH